MGRWVWGLDRQPNLSAHGVGHPFGIVREVRHPIPINQKLSSSAAPYSVSHRGGVDTQFCTHDLIKENDLNDQFMYPKNHKCITYINLFFHYMHHFVFALHALIHSLHIIKMILIF